MYDRKVHRFQICEYKEIKNEKNKHLIRKNKTSATL